MVKSYWIQVHKIAWRNAAKNLGFTNGAAVMIRVVLGASIVAALTFWGSEDAARDEMIARAAIAGAVLASFPIVYFYELVAAPARLDAERSNKIDDLELKNRARLSRRTLTGEQKAVLSDAIRSNGARPPMINVLYDNAESECADFAADIGDAIRAAGIESQVHDGMFYDRDVRDRGIKIIRDKRSAILRSLADDIHGAFVTLGFQPERRDDEENDHIFLYVARRSES